MATLAELVVKISGDTASLMAALGRAEKNSHDFASNVSSKMKMLGGVIMGAAASFGAFEAVKGAVSATAQLGEAVHDMAEQTGMSAEASSQLLFALKSTGVESDKASTALGRFAKNMFAVTLAEDDGSKALNTNQKILAGLGITATDVSGQMRPLQDIVLDLADKIAAMGDSGTKTAMVLSLFGKGGLPMLEFLNQGRAGIEELMKTADKLGLTLSGENVAQIHAYTVAQRQMGEAIAGLKLQIGIELMPKLTQLSNWFIEHQPQMRAFVSEGIDYLKASLVILGSIVNDVRGGLGQLPAVTDAASRSMALLELKILETTVSMIHEINAIAQFSPLLALLGPAGIAAAVGIVAGQFEMQKALKWTETRIKELQGSINSFDSSPMNSQFQLTLQYALAAGAGIAQVQAAMQMSLAPAIGEPLDAEVERMKRNAGLLASTVTPAVFDYTAATIDAGGAAVKTAETLTDAEKGLISLLNAFNVSGLSVEQYTFFLNMAQEAMTHFNLTGDQLAAVIQTSGLAAMDFAERIQRLTALDDLTEQAKTAMDAVNGLYDAFNNVFAKPTKEGAAQNLALAQLKEQRARLLAGGEESDSRKVKKIDEQIDAIQKEIDVRRASQDVAKAQLDLADQTKLTDEQQNIAVGLITTAMGTASGNAQTLAGSLFNLTQSLAQWGLQMRAWVETVTAGHPSAQTSRDIYDSLSDEGRRYVDIMAGLQNAPSFANGGVMPYTGFAHLEKGEPVGSAAGVRGGFTNYGRVDIHLENPSANFLEELERQLR